MDEPQSGSEDTRGFIKLLLVPCGLFFLVPGAQLPAGVGAVALGLVYLCTYLVEPAGQKAIEAAEEHGGGGGWLAIALIMALLFGGLIILGMFETMLTVRGM